MNLIGQRVQFSISDIHLPESEEVLKLLYGAELITGQVRGLIESTKPEGWFVVVTVEGLEQMVIVSAQRISLPFSGSTTCSVSTRDA